MKTTLLRIALAATLAVASAAQAQTWSVPNQSGGKIVITTRPCPDKDFPVLFEAYAFSVTGERTPGCWTVLDGLVQIAWGQGRRSIFEQGAFTADQGPAPARGKPASRGQAL